MGQGVNEALGGAVFDVGFVHGDDGASGGHFQQGEQVGAVQQGAGRVVGVADVEDFYAG